jgi:hydroxymethylpyrimidine pyrophosphatase-like HAD family hydrolase
VIEWAIKLLEAFSKCKVNPIFCTAKEMYFEDSGNDISMLEYADMGIAMGNA